MSSLINLLRQITNHTHLGPSIPLLQNVPASKFTIQILLLLRNVLQINSKDVQQYNGLVIVYKLIHDGMKYKYNDSEWTTISEPLSDIIVTIFESVLNYQKSHFLKEKPFCNLMQHAVHFLLPMITEIDLLRIPVTKNGFSAIMGVVCMENLEFTIRKDLLLLFKQVLVRADLRLRRIIVSNHEVTLNKIAQLTLFCGDFEMQECITEMLMRFSLTSKQKMTKITQWYKNNPQVVGLINLLDYNNFDTSCREFLNRLNEINTSDIKVISLPCLEAFANDIHLQKPKNEKYKELWADFSVSSGSIHIVCDGGGNTWMKLYVEYLNVKNILCSNRDTKESQQVKQILVELITPLKVQLYSSERFIITILLRFLEVPKFYTLEECFFKKCYNNVYKVEKQIWSQNSSIKTGHSQNNLENQGPKLHRHSNMKLPLLTSTPKPAESKLSSINNNVNQDTWKQERANKYSEPIKYSVDKKSTAVHMAIDRNEDHDKSFKAMCEAALEGLSQSMSQEKAPKKRPKRSVLRAMCDKGIMEETHSQILSQSQEMLQGKTAGTNNTPKTLPEVKVPSGNQSKVQKQPQEKPSTMSDRKSGFNNAFKALFEEKLSQGDENRLQSQSREMPEEKPPTTSDKKIGSNNALFEEKLTQRTQPEEENESQSQILSQSQGIPQENTLGTSAKKSGINTLPEEKLLLGTKSQLQMQLKGMPTCHSKTSINNELEPLSEEEMFNKTQSQILSQSQGMTLENTLSAKKSGITTFKTLFDDKMLQGTQNQPQKQSEGMAHPSTTSDNKSLLSNAFKGLFEEKPSQGSQNQPLSLPQVDVPRETSPTTNKKSDINNTYTMPKQKLTFKSADNQNAFETSSKHKDKEFFENNLEEQSQESPFHLTSKRQVDSTKTPALGQPNNINTGLEKSKSDNIQTHTESNVKKSTNLPVFRAFTKQDFCLKDSDKTNTRFNKLSNSQQIDNAKTDSNKSSSGDSSKSSEPNAKEQRDTLSGEVTSTKSTLAPSRFSNFSFSDSENSFSDKKNATELPKADLCISRPNDETKEIIPELPSEPKTKKKKILRSPKLLSKEGKSDFNKNLESSRNIENVKKNILELFNKTKNVLPPNDKIEGNTEADIEKCESNHANIKNGTDQIKTVDPPPMPSPINYQKNETSTSENKNDIKNLRQEPSQGSNFSDIKKLPDENLKKNVRRNYKKRAYKRRSSGPTKIDSPDCSFHLRMPVRTYNCRNASKFTSKLLTPEKIFENLKHQKNIRKIDVNDGRGTRNRKRKLFNPNASLEDISSLASEKQSSVVSKNPKPLPSLGSPVVESKKPTEKNLFMSNEEEPMLFDDIYKFSAKYNKKVTQNNVKRPRRSVNQRLKPNYVEVSSDDSLSAQTTGKRVYTFSKNYEFTRQQKKEIHTNVATNENLLYEVSKSVSEEETSNKKESTLPEAFTSSSRESESAKAKRSLILSQKSEQTNEDENSNKKVDSNSSTKNPNETYTVGTKFTEISDNCTSSSQIEPQTCNDLQDQRPLGLFLKSKGPKEPPKPSDTNEPRGKRRKKHENVNEKTDFASLIESSKVCDVLRDKEESEMRLEEAPVEERKSDVSSLDLEEPPIRFSSDDSIGQPPGVSVRQIENSSKLNSTGTQAEARAEIGFLDTIITSLEKMSLAGGRKKILKEVGSLESALNKLEMFTKAKNDEMTKKCKNLKKSLDLMKSNLENIITARDEFDKSFENKMSDIKSTMTRLSKDVENDQDIKVKIIEDIGKMCRERKSIVRVDNFF